MPDWTRIASVEDCPAGKSIEIVHVGRVIALYHLEGKFYALDGVCPHQGGPLGKGTMTGCVVTCPWHGWQFDVVTGIHLINENIQQPGFDVRVEDGAVFIRLDEDKPA